MLTSDSFSRLSTCDDVEKRNFVRRHVPLKGRKSTHFWLTGQALRTDVLDDEASAAIGASDVHFSLAETSPGRDEPWPRRALAETSLGRDEPWPRRTPLSSDPLPTNASSGRTSRVLATALRRGMHVCGEWVYSKPDATGREEGSRGGACAAWREPYGLVDP